MNDQESKTNEQQNESVADLELRSEQTEEIQGGSQSVYPNFRGGIYVATGDLN